MVCDGMTQLVSQSASLAGPVGPSSPGLFPRLLLPRLLTLVMIAFALAAAAVLIF